MYMKLFPSFIKKFVPSDSKENNEFSSNSGFATLLDYPLSSFINCQVLLLFLILFFRILLH